MIAEKVVIGSILEENYLIEESGLLPEQFADPVNKNIFSAMKHLAGEKKSIDVVGLLMYMGENIRDIGGATYLTETSKFANPAKFDEYCEAILKDWKHKEKNRILQQAITEDWEQETVITKLSSLESAKMDDYHSMDEMLAKKFESPFSQETSNNPGIKSGIVHLDTMTNGWQNSELIVIAARPSLGKTDVLLHFARQAGWNNCVPVIFSLEMSADSLTDRNIATVGRYNRSKMRDPYTLLSDEQKDRWAPAFGELSETKIEVYDAAGQTLAEMRAKLRKSIHRFPDRKPIVFIDYLTLIKPAEKLSNNHLQVGAITKGLKAMAKEFDCPVVVLSQLSRGVEQRQDKRPMLSDLRESGSIEEDCDVAIMLYRESYYDKETDDNTLEMIVAKNRNGATGTVVTAYNKITGGIYNIDFAGNN